MTHVGRMVALGKVFVRAVHNVHLISSALISTDPSPASCTAAGVSLPTELVLL